MNANDNMKEHIAVYQKATIAKQVLKDIKTGIYDAKDLDKETKSLLEEIYGINWREYIYVR